MEEKKLTDEVVVAKNAIPDEEIAKAILQSIEYGKTITYFDEWGNCKSIFVKDILDLIHRLQGENKQLKCDSYRTSWKAKFLEAKKEIERLTRESDEMFDRHAKETQAATLLIEKRNNEIAELQKQVDELKDTLELQKTLYNRAREDGYCTGYKSAVKDTAKEICEFILKYWQGHDLVECDWLRVAIAEKYGVEVE